MLIRHYSEPDKGLWRTEFSITVSVKVNRAPDDDAADAPDDDADDDNGGKCHALLLLMMIIVGVKDLESSAKVLQNESTTSSEIVFKFPLKETCVFARDLFAGFPTFNKIS